MSYISSYIHSCSAPKTTLLQVSTVPSELAVLVRSLETIRYADKEYTGLFSDQAWSWLILYKDIRQKCLKFSNAIVSN